MTDHGQHDQGETPTCPFCAIVAGQAPAVIAGRWPGVIATIPLNPVTQGHVLVLPTEHVEDFADDPDITAEVMRRAAQFATPPANLITSAGPEATQTVRHLHVHVVPRWPGDGLKLPWTEQQQPGDDGRRVAQIDAVIGKLEYAGIVEPNALAAEVVDAVNAADPDERAKRHAAGYLDEIGPEPPATLPYDAEDQWRAQITDTRTGYRFMLPQQPGDEELRDVQQLVRAWYEHPHHAVQYLHRWVGPWMRANPDGTLVDGDHSAADQLDQARAAGYRDAITALRDDAGYRAWVRRQGFTAELGGTWRASIADYLEAVGPGQEDRKLTEGESEHRVLLDTVEIAPDGTTHTYWSTHCRHGRHADCAATEITGSGTTRRGVVGKVVHVERPVSIARQPAQCKTCAARCICDCHKPVSDG